MNKEQKQNLLKLETGYSKLENKLRAIRHKIEDVKNKELLPDLKKKFEGKYWKYDNGSGREQRWWLYSFCKEVKGVYSYTFISFETTPYGNEFKIDESVGNHLCQKRITKAEYDREARKFLRKANKILQA